MNYTPLILSIKESNYEAIKILLFRYHVNPNLTDSDGWSPLMFAVIQDNKVGFEIMKLLIECHGNIQYKNKNNLTIIHLADFGKYREIYNYLMSLK